MLGQWDGDTWILIKFSFFMNFLLVIRVMLSQKNNGRGIFIQIGGQRAILYQFQYFRDSSDPFLIYKISHLEADFFIFLPFHAPRRKCIQALFHTSI